jgi:membrane-associated phospholipid phosphatase
MLIFERLRGRTPQWALFLLVACVSMAPPVRAGGGPFGIDSVVTLDNRGIWARHNQLLLLDLMLAGTGAAALWEGGDTRFGRTMWQSVDATLVGGVASELLKLTFSRERPDQTSSPNQWFKGHGSASFPSGEVTVTSAIVTPLVLEYGAEHPAIYALEVLPIYDAIARVKVHGHWQSDVIAGFALGSAAGYFMHKRQGSPLVLSVIPHGIFVGLKTRF